MSYLKYLFFILKEYLFLKEKNEIIKNPFLLNLLECIDLVRACGVMASWDGWEVGKMRFPPLVQ